MRIGVTAALVILLISTVCPAATPAAATRPAATRPAGDAGEFASFGVSFPPPQGWHRVVEGSTGMIARWVDTPPQQGALQAILTLEMEPAAGRSAEQYAAAAATRSRGKVTPTNAVIGGIKAIAITGGALANKMSADSLLVPRGNYIYVIGGLAPTPEQVPMAAMEALGRSVVFRDLAEPSSVTMLRDEAFPVFGKFTMKPLATMRPNPDPPDEGHIGVSTYNYRARRPDFALDVQIVPNLNRLPLRALGERTTAMMSKQNIAWGVTSSTPQRAISKTFTATDPRAKTTMTGRLGLVQLNDVDVVLLTFIFVNLDPAALAAYERASEEIVGSVQPLAK